MKYTVYFEIYGKKLKTTVEADTEYQAKNKVRDAIKFHKVEKNFEDHLFDFLGLKRK